MCSELHEVTEMMVEGWMDGHCCETNSKRKLRHHRILWILFFFEKDMSLMTKCKFTNPFIVIWKKISLYIGLHSLHINATEHNILHTMTFSLTAVVSLNLCMYSTRGNESVAHQISHLYEMHVMPVQGVTMFNRLQH